MNEKLRKLDGLARNEVSAPRISSAIDKVGKIDLPFNLGNVNEDTPAANENFGDDTGGAGAATSGMSSKVIVIEPPSETERIKADISKKIESEIRVLIKTASSLSRKTKEFNASELSNVVAKIRKLKNLLAELPNMLPDALRALWKRMFQ